MARTQHQGVGTLPTELESSQAKLVYLYLDATGRATVDDISDGLDMRLITLFSILRTLEREGLVEERGDHYHPV